MTMVQVVIVIDVRSYKVLDPTRPKIRWMILIRLPRALKEKLCFWAPNGILNQAWCHGHLVPILEQLTRRGGHSITCPGIKASYLLNSATPVNNGFATD